MSPTGTSNPLHSATHTGASTLRGQTNNPLTSASKTDSGSGLRETSASSMSNQLHPSEAKYSGPVREEMSAKAGDPDMHMKGSSSSSAKTKGSEAAHGMKMTGKQVKSDLKDMGEHVKEGVRATRENVKGSKK